MAWLRQALARPGAAVILVTTGFLIVATSWALASPIGTATDDDYHLPSIWCATGPERGICETVSTSGDSAQLVSVPRQLVFRCFVSRYPPEVLSPRCLSAIDGQFARTGGVRGLNGRDTSATEGSLTYGPYFYTMARILVTTDVEASILRIRLLNAGIAAAMLAAALTIASVPIRRALSWSWALALVPLGYFYISSSNPSSWTIIGMGTLWAFLLTWLAEPNWRSPRALVALTGVLAACALVGPTRRDGWFYVLATLIACLLLTGRVRAEILTRWLLTLLGAVVIAVRIVAPSYNYGLGLVQGSALLQANGAAPGTSSAESNGGLTGMLVATMREAMALPKSLWSVLGGNMRGENYTAYGLNEIHLPVLVPILMCIPLVVLLAFGWRWHPRPKVLAVLSILGAFILSTLTHKMLMPAGFAIQPRHLVPLMLVGVALSLLGPRALELPAKAAAMCGLSIMLAGTVALVFTQARYTVGGWQWSRTTEHWWWSSLVAGPSWNILLSLTGLGLLTLGSVLLSLPPAVGTRTDSWDSPISASASGAGRSGPRTE